MLYYFRGCLVKNWVYCQKTYTAYDVKVSGNKAPYTLDKYDLSKHLKYTKSAIQSFFKKRVSEKCHENISVGIFFSINCRKWAYRLIRGFLYWSFHGILEKQLVRNSSEWPLQERHWIFFKKLALHSHVSANKLAKTFQFKMVIVSNTTFSKSLGQVLLL